MPLNLDSLHRPGSTQVLLHHSNLSSHPIFSRLGSLKAKADQPCLLRLHAGSILSLALAGGDRATLASSLCRLSCAVRPEQSSRMLPSSMSNLVASVPQSGAAVGDNHQSQQSLQLAALPSRQVAARPGLLLSSVPSQPAPLSVPPSLFLVVWLALSFPYPQVSCFHRSFTANLC